MADYDNQDSSNTGSGNNDEFLELQNDQESQVKTASHTEVSDPNSDYKGENIVDDSNQGGDSYGQSTSGGDDSNTGGDSYGQSTSGGDNSNTGDDSYGQSTGGGDYRNTGDDSAQPSSGGDDSNQQSGGDNVDSSNTGGDDSNEGGDDDSGEGSKKEGKIGRVLENPDSIPSAGGEQLGKKHWGESKIVPDVPPKQDEGVSSGDGQPDDETSANTAKNAGGSGDGDGKKGLMEKIKEKLPGGNN